MAPSFGALPLLLLARGGAASGVYTLETMVAEKGENDGMNDAERLNEA